MIKFQIRDGSRRFDVNDRSLGFRWFFSFMLFTQFRVARSDLESRPLLFLFDEPTAELDPPMAVTIYDEILKLKNTTHATSIVVTHDRTLAFSLADRVAMFMDGQILFVGTPDEVKRHADPRVQGFINAKPPNAKSP